jgi:hypothetical protein
MVIDPKHLPEDPQVLQRMVLDLSKRLDREFTERNKMEALLRELLDAKRDRTGRNPCVAGYGSETTPVPAGRR